MARSKRSEWQQWLTWPSHPQPVLASLLFQDLSLYFQMSPNQVAISWGRIELPWWLRWWRIYLQCGRLGFHPWIGKVPWRRKRQPAPGFLPRESHGQRSLVDYSPWACKESDTTQGLALDLDRRQMAHPQTEAPFSSRSWGGMSARRKKGSQSSSLFTASI